MDICQRYHDADHGKLICRKSLCDAFRNNPRLNQPVFKPPVGIADQLINAIRSPYMLNNKTALVTGSTSGIGLGIAKALARQGANIMLNGFGDVDAAKAEVAALGVRVGYHAADMSKPAEIEAMMAAAAAEFGRVDVLVNNAGIQHVAAIQDFPTERWDAIIAINLSSAFHTTRLALPAMQAAGWGRVINVASVHGLVASAQKSAYVAAKHGIVGLTKVTALETATTGVTCNAICPGWVLTPLVQKQVDAKAAALNVSNEEAKRLLLAEKEPSLQFTTPEELGELAVFFCSAAANNIRGVAWQMDGGWTAQ
jgi:3-hydroxybutyrate dehydrogenase